VIARVAMLAGLGCGLAVIAAPAAGAMPAALPSPVMPVPVGPGQGSQTAASASLSTVRAGARPVALTLRLRYEMICGRPGAGAVVVVLPQAVSVPASIAPAAVLVNGHRTSRVRVSGHTVSIALPAKGGITCHVVAPGVLELVFTRSARLGNPAASGTYAIHVRRNALRFVASVRIAA
jgi:hypothetical protein